MNGISPEPDYAWALVPLSIMFVLPPSVVLVFRFLLIFEVRLIWKFLYFILLGNRGKEVTSLYWGTGDMYLIGRAGRSSFWDVGLIGWKSNVCLIEGTFSIEYFFMLKLLWVLTEGLYESKSLAASSTCDITLTFCLNYVGDLTV